MPDDFKTLYNEILQSSVKENLPKAIRERFEVLSCLTFDNTKELYLVRGRQDGKKGVMRVTKGVATTDAAAEADILNGLHHPAIPRIIGQWNERDRSFLIREYFDGTTLRARIMAQGILTADQILDAAIDLCDVLSYIHSQTPPVIHRDIKPDNIILTREGGIKLIDFGIARKFLPGASKDTQIIGTEPYMAPEQYGSEQTDGRADIYALGVVMIHMATGQDGKQFLNEAFPYKTLVSVIEKCIKSDRSQRFQSAERLKKRLLRIRRHTIRKIILCAGVCAAAIAAFEAGFHMGKQYGFDQGVEWMMDTPAAPAGRYSVEDGYQPVEFDSREIDMAVRNILNREQEAPIYLTEVRSRVGTLQIYGTYIPHPALNVAITKSHKEKDLVEYWSSDGFQISDRGDIHDLSDVSIFYYLRELALSSQSIICHRFNISPACKFSACGESSLIIMIS